MEVYSETGTFNSLTPKRIQKLTLFRDTEIKREKSQELDPNTFASEEFFEPFEDIEVMIRIRSDIIKDYNNNGLDKWNAIVKKEKKWHLYNTSDIFKFCATHFDNIMDAMFFVFYLICEHPKRIRTTYMEDPSTFFNKIFSKCVDFKIFKELVVYSILYI